MGDCVVAEIDRLKKILADPLVAPGAKKEPLMFLAHFLGDTSQPLHCAERTANGMPDAGGNTFFVTFNGHKEHINNAVTFHSVWDSTLILDQIFDWGAMVMDIEAKTLPTLDKSQIASGTTSDWANDCHDAGVAIYTALGPTAPLADDRDHPFALTVAYADATLPIVKQQLAKGGIHLATVLNSVLAAPEGAGK